VHIRKIPVQCSILAITDNDTRVILRHERKVFAMTDETTGAIHQAATAGSPDFATLIERAYGTPRAEIDRIVDQLYLRKDEWVRLGLSDRVKILDALLADFRTIRHRWIAAELKAKGNPAHSSGEAEEWVILATAFRIIRKLRQSLIELEKHGRPMFVGSPMTRSDGRVIVRVFPKTLDDRVLFPGVTGEVWMERGVSAEDVIETQAWAYRDSMLDGKVALVLGAGNAAVLPVADVLHKLFVELQVVVLKLNPVNAHMGPLFEEGLQTLIDMGYLGIVYGGVEEGSHICDHPKVTDLHMTGSDKTYEAIVFGPGEDGRRRKAQRKPKLTKRFTGELGNVSPVIVVPGPWSQQEIDQQARYISTWLVANAGFGCLTPRVIIQHENWRHRSDLVDAMGRVLEQVPTRKAYYPGSHQRHSEFVSHHPEAHEYGSRNGDHLPWTIIPGLDPSNTNEICFKREAFFGLCAETALEAPSIPEFLERAVEFSNRTLWGTLCATLIVHPESLHDPDIAKAVDRAFAGLRYGTVSTNILAYYSAYLMGTPWGAFPGSEINDIQSGTGKTFNTLMFARPEKSVVRAPFKRLEPTEVLSKHAVELCKRLAEFEATPSFRKLTSLGLVALRS
jgi:acyl-CoA reductase-like NAD-dependent aldehyde dehydrogenase